MPLDGSKDQGVEGAAKSVTSTVCSCSQLTTFILTMPVQVGNAAGGVSKTLGGIVGAAGQG